MCSSFILPQNKNSFIYPDRLRDSPFHDVGRRLLVRSPLLSVLHQLDTQEESNSAHVADARVLLRQHLTAVEEVLPHDQRVLPQVLLLDGVEDCVGDGAGDWITTVLEQAKKYHQYHRCDFSTDVLRAEADTNKDNENNCHAGIFFPCLISSIECLHKIRRDKIIFGGQLNQQVINTRVLSKYKEVSPC
jgi:hypothetical protein